MFIAFATALGAVALDEGKQGGTSGPYSSALASELVKPGQDHLQLFQNVKEGVFASTGRQQVPWERNGLLKRIYFGGGAQAGRQTSAPNMSDEVKALKEQLAKMESELKRREDEQRVQQVAVPTPPAPPAFDATMATHRIQEGLNRVGCLAVAATGTWGPRTRAAAARFNERSGQAMVIDRATEEAVVLLEGNTTRVCPPECEWN